MLYSVFQLSSSRPSTAYVDPTAGLQLLAALPPLFAPRLAAKHWLSSRTQLHLTESSALYAFYRTHFRLTDLCT